ncbi:unnamed protein product, partial [Urochloa humidicola]
SRVITYDFLLPLQNTVTKRAPRFDAYKFPFRFVPSVGLPSPCLSSSCSDRVQTPGWSLCCVLLNFLTYLLSSGYIFPSVAANLYIGAVCLLSDGRSS